MRRNIVPAEHDDLGDYWKKCEGRFLNGWYSKSLKYIQKNIPNDLFLEWKNGNYIVSKKN